MATGLDEDDEYGFMATKVLNASEFKSTEMFTSM